MTNKDVVVKSGRYGGLACSNPRANVPVDFTPPPTAYVLRGSESAMEPMSAGLFLVFLMAAWMLGSYLGAL